MNTDKREKLQELIDNINYVIKRRDEEYAHIDLQKHLKTALAVVEAYESNLVGIDEIKKKTTELLLKSEELTEKYYDEEERKSDSLVFTKMTTLAFSAIDYFLNATES
ncbi:hypothetical protein QNI16_17545 [Cytophagaceae bacterium YF14B1]|uniref:Uncharacterized protein n=1 Tax=Xanthocytophaga flava TaxID=3048013 RepID=A0AAE3UA18_9BACT|nr:hypothetical protein [Xanthocytophaga flavus]MDJ1482314.1 hypothetical protein [Xanthocytophaga flavus]